MAARARRILERRAREGRSEPGLALVRSRWLWRSGRMARGGRLALARSWVPAPLRGAELRGLDTVGGAFADPRLLTGAAAPRSSAGGRHWRLARKRQTRSPISWATYSQGRLGTSGNSPLAT